LDQQGKLVAVEAPRLGESFAGVVEGRQGGVTGGTVGF
jgi:hypothetical protein